MTPRELMQQAENQLDAGQLAQAKKTLQELTIAWDNETLTEIEEAKTQKLGKKILACQCATS